LREIKEKVRDAIIKKIKRLKLYEGASDKPSKKFLFVKIN